MNEVRFKRRHLHAGEDKVTVLPLFPHYAMSSYESAAEAAKEHAAHLQMEASVVPPFYRNEGYILFRDPAGYPPLTPPWGTLNAIDLDKGARRANSAEDFDMSAGDVRGRIGRERQSDCRGGGRFQ